MLHVLSRKPAKFQSTRYKVKKTDVLLAPNQSFFIDSSPISSAGAELLNSPQHNNYSPPVKCPENPETDDEEDIWTLSHNFLPPYPKTAHTLPSNPATDITPNVNTLTGPGLFQHFPTSPIASRISLSDDNFPDDLKWDDYDSFQSLSNTPFPSPPMHLNTPTPEKQSSSDKLEPFPLAINSKSSTSDEVFTDDIGKEILTPLRAPKKTKRRSKCRRRRLCATNIPGRPLQRQPPCIQTNGNSSTDRDLSENRRYPARPRKLPKKYTDFEI